LWREGQAGTPYQTGEPGWKVNLHLGAIGLQADHRLKAPVLDGVIEPGEYGPGLTFSDDPRTNPGHVVKHWSRAQGWHVTVAPPSRDDLSATIFTACTDSDLFIAVRVKDDEVATQDPQNGFSDTVQVFLDADRIPNDFLHDPSSALGSIGRKQNREGFYLGAEASGRKWNPSGDLTDKDWDLAVGSTPGGYVTEFRIPLRILDTQDGPGQKFPEPGSSVRFNLSLYDYDPHGGPDSGLALWLEPAHTNLWGNLEPSWVVPLHLARPARYEQIKGPSRAAIDPESGVFRWTPPYGPFREEVTIRVVDRQKPGLSSERIFHLRGDGTGPPVRIEVRPTDWPATGDGSGLLPPQLVIETPTPSGLSAADRAASPSSAASLTTRRGDSKLDQEIARSREAVRLNPGDPKLHNTLAHDLTAQGEWDEAIAEAREALRLNPDFASAHNNLAYLLVIHPDPGRRSHAEALVHARRAVELSREDGSFQNTLGIVELSNSHLREAESALRKSMEIRAGGDPYDWFPMAVVCARQGRKEEARRWFDRAEASPDAKERSDAGLLQLWIEAAKAVGSPAPESAAAVPSRPAAPVKALARPRTKRYRPTDSLEPDLSQARLADILVAHAWLHREQGQPDRIIRFLPDGTVRVQNANPRVTWKLDGRQLTQSWTWRGPTYTLSAVMAPDGLSYSGKTVDGRPFGGEAMGD
jgi:Flp pilus assembly protein TadD